MRGSDLQDAAGFTLTVLVRLAAAEMSARALAIEFASWRAKACCGAQHRNVHSCRQQLHVREHVLRALGWPNIAVFGMRGEFTGRLPRVKALMITSHEE